MARWQIMVLSVESGQFIKDFDVKVQGGQFW